METDPIAMCELLVGLPAVKVLGVDDDDEGPLRVHGETRRTRCRCERCEAPGWVKDRPRVELVDLAAFGVRLVWCGTSVATSARTRSALRGRGPNKTRGSQRRGWR